MPEEPKTFSFSAAMSSEEFAATILRELVHIHALLKTSVTLQAALLAHLTKSNDVRTLLSTVTDSEDSFFLQQLEELLKSH